MSTEPFHMLDADLPEPALDEGWRAVQHKRVARVRAKHARRGAYLVLSVVALVLVRFLWPLRDTQSGTPAALALHYQGGAPLAALVEASEKTSLVDLDDGSKLTLDQGAALVPMVNDGRTFGVSLARGRATFDVKPGGPRRWEIDAGIARVVVLGTKFSVARRDQHVVVAVERGHVRVESEAISGHVRDLYAGEEVDVSAAVPLLPATVATIVDIVPAPRATTVAAPLVPPPPPRASASPVITEAPAPESVREKDTAPDWRSLARKGDFKAAYALLGPSGFATEVHAATGGEQLLSLSDIAKSSGHPAEARAPLDRVVAEFPGDAALAAFARGRLELEALGQPGAAAQWFERARTLGLPEPLKETAMGRRVEALHRAGDAAGAKTAAEAYVSTYPGGRYREAVTVWSAP